MLPEVGVTMRAAALALSLFLAGNAVAEYRVCRSNGRAVWTDREPCDEILMPSYQCDMVPGAPCVPPPKLTLNQSPAPFSVEVTFGEEFIWQGQRYWRYMRGGAVHFVTPRFFLRVPP